MRRLLAVALLCLGIFCQAQERPRHQVSLGWGDMLFETLAFHPSQTRLWDKPESLPADYRLNERTKYGYTGHIFADYSFRWTRRVSVGAQLDFQGIFWSENTLDRYGKTLESFRSRNFDLTLLPTVRFFWMDKPMVRLYSGLGAGLLMAFDNARHFELAPAVNLNFLSVQIGKGPWCGTVEWGMLSALTNFNNIYMLGSRILSFSVNYRW